jgi:cytochrome P450
MEMNVRSSVAHKLPADLQQEAGRIPVGPSILFFVKRSRRLTNPHRILDVFREIVDRWGLISSSRSGLSERTYIVAHHSAIDKIFRSHQSFTKYPHPTADLAKLEALIGKGLLATHTDEEWASHRQSVARFFSRTSAGGDFAEIVLRQVNKLLDETLAQSPQVVNISELAMRLSGRVMSDILVPDYPLPDEAFLKIKRLLDQSILDFHRWDFKRRARPYKAALREQASLYIERAERGGEKDGLVRRLMVDEPSWQTDKAARERLLDRTINLIVTGYETTATSLNWVAHLLAAFPGVQERLRNEVNNNLYGDGTVPEAFDDNTLLRRSIAEAMRLYTVLWFNIRYVTQEVTIEGARFVRGSRVMLLPFIANRSASVYTAPDSFNPDRYLEGEPAPLFPFGNGQRVCIGRRLAELEMQAFVVGLLRRFRLESVCSPKAIGGVLLQPDQDISVRFTPL